MPKIIISYRRADTDAIAGRIRDRLERDYGKNSIFMDIDNIPFGTDFREHIQNAILQNDLLLAVVGPNWTGPNETGTARIEEETDLVRIEVETAMKAHIPVIPLLVNGAPMPKAEDLPDSLKDFAFKNAAPVDSGRDFHLHMDRLVRSINRLVSTHPRAFWIRWRFALTQQRLAATAAAVLAVAVVALLASRWDQLFGPRAPEPQTVATPVSSAPPQGQTGAAAPGETVVDFSRFADATNSAQPVAARPYLHQYGISVIDLVPPSSEIVLVNNRGLYVGAAVVPTASQNLLTQITTGNEKASYTLTFAEPIDEFRFLRPQLFRDTKSGVTHPAWTATALDAEGRQLSAQSEGLLRSLDQMPGDISARTYILRTPNFDRIASVRFESDPRLNGRPFAAFAALLIERIVLLRRGGSPSSAR
jgi:hypothetical protein